MRDDIARIMGECGRTTGKSPKTALRVKNPTRIAHIEPLDDLPKRLPMLPRGYRKDTGIRIGPLHRILHAQVGRPWDTVFSQFSHRLRSKNGNVCGTRRRLDEWEVSQHCVMSADGIVREFGYGGLAPVEGFYVHPATRTLEYQPPKRYKCATAPASDRVTLTGDDGCHFAEQKDGIWYEFIVERYELLGKKRERVLLKRQLSTKELRTLGLRNSIAG